MRTDLKLRLAVWAGHKIESASVWAVWKTLAFPSVSVFFIRCAEHGKYLWRSAGAKRRILSSDNPDPWDFWEAEGRWREFDTDPDFRFSGVFTHGVFEDEVARFGDELAPGGDCVFGPKAPLDPDGYDPHGNWVGGQEE